MRLPEKKEKGAEQAVKAPVVLGAKNIAWFFSLFETGSPIAEATLELLLLCFQSTGISATCTTPTTAQSELCL